MKVNKCTGTEGGEGCLSKIRRTRLRPFRSIIPKLSPRNNYGPRNCLAKKIADLSAKRKTDRTARLPRIVSYIQQHVVVPQRFNVRDGYTITGIAI